MLSLFSQIPGDLKSKPNREESELFENIGQLKMPAEDGKMRKTNVVNTEQFLNTKPFDKKVRLNLDIKIYFIP